MQIYHIFDGLVGGRTVRAGMFNAADVQDRDGGVLEIEVAMTARYWLDNTAAGVMRVAQPSTTPQPRR